MKFIKSKIGLLTLILFLIGLIYGLYQFNKPHINIAKSKPSFVITAVDLTKEYEQDEWKAEKKYSGMIIEVTGIVKEISINNDKKNIILYGNKSNVSCQMNVNSSDVKKEQSVTIRGNCAGFLMDVMLTDAILILTNN
jgi:hypothetical protein